MHGKAMLYAIVSNNISGTNKNLKGSKLVNLSVKPNFVKYKHGAQAMD